MTRPFGPVLAVLAALFSWLRATPAAAQGSLCRSVVIEADGAVRARWSGLAGRVRQAFEGRDDVDRCARVALAARNALLRVQVDLPDGRSASRSLLRPEDVIPAIEALVLLPSPAPPPAAEATGSDASGEASTPPPPPAAVAPPRPIVAVGSAPAAVDHDTAAASRGESSRWLGIELSVMTGARVGDGQSGVGLGAVSLVDLSGWLVGLEGRVDRYHAQDGASDATAQEVAILVGRRFPVGGSALDVVTGPAAVFQGTTTLETRSLSTGDVVSKSHSGDVARVLLGARWTFAARSIVRPFVGADGEVGPRSAGGLLLPGEPQLPAWSLGLALGATVGTP